MTLYTIAGILQQQTSPPPAGGAPTVEGSTTVLAASAPTSVDLVLPSETVEGHTLVAIVVNASGSFAMSGWTTEANSDQASAIGVFTKAASAADETNAGSGTYAVTITGGGDRCVGVMVAVAGASGTDVVGVTNDGSFNSTWSLDAVTTTVDDCLVLACYGNSFAGRTVASGSPGVQVAAITGGGLGTDCSVDVHEFDQEAAGTTGSLTATANGSGTGTSAAIALAP